MAALWSITRVLSNPSLPEGSSALLLAPGQPLRPGCWAACPGQIERRDILNLQRWDYLTDVLKVRQRNEFLTSWARKYCAEIDDVFLCKLTEAYLGLAARDRQTKRYEIYLDPRRYHCSYKLIFTLFHEIGHIVLGHYDIMPESKGKSDRNFIEVEADNWALGELGINCKKSSARSRCDECIMFARSECFLHSDSTRCAAAGIAAQR